MKNGKESERTKSSRPIILPIFREIDRSVSASSIGRRFPLLAVKRR